MNIENHQNLYTYIFKHVYSENIDIFLFIEPHQPGGSYTSNLTFLWYSKLGI